MAAVYKNCRLCGKKFKVCGTCFKDVPEELQWRRVVCCPQHFAYYLPVIRYHRNEIGKSEARAELQDAVDRFGEVQYSSDIKGIVDEILEE